MSGTLRKRATGMFNKAPAAPEAIYNPTDSQPSRPRSQMRSHTLNQGAIDVISEDMEKSGSCYYSMQATDYSPDPTFDDAHLSHISPEFAKMRPWDFELPKYEFYNEKESWFNENVSLEDVTLQDTALVNEVLLDEDVIATTICFAKAGKPRMVDVSPPPSIRSSRQSQSSEYSARYHSRPSSYASQSDSKSASDVSDYDEDSSLSTPVTPSSTHSKGFFSFQKRKPVAVYHTGPKKTGIAS